eukprot:TRINITY_DN27988_c0_g1_i1.p1 TRINITY_DN27988_c0_g1~~TRINITY_DN27988_c0_g1_i1.p1  ORF type:complete len:177 (+),score=27.03 TRINITY_DN27988_c0_g1_i1:258-788(+)
MYLVNGKDAQHRDSLRYGAHSAGIGDVCQYSISGAHKMAEAAFDAHKFTELLIINDLFGTQYVWKLFRPSKIPFSSREVFAVSSCRDLQKGVTIETEDGTTVLAHHANAGCGSLGPLFVDPFNISRSWMGLWRDPRHDLRKGDLSTRVKGSGSCLLYTSDAADDLLCVDLGGRRII